MFLNRMILPNSQADLMTVQRLCVGGGENPSTGIQGVGAHKGFYVMKLDDLRQVPHKFKEEVQKKELLNRVVIFTHEKDVPWFLTRMCDVRVDAVQVSDVQHPEGLSMVFDTEVPDPFKPYTEQQREDILAAIRKEAYTVADWKKDTFYFTQILNESGQLNFSVGVLGAKLLPRHAVAFRLSRLAEKV